MWTGALADLDGPDEGGFCGLLPLATGVGAFSVVAAVAPLRRFECGGTTSSATDAAAVDGATTDGPEGCSVGRFLAMLRVRR